MMKQVGRNDACPCGSGKKYKKCCGSNVVSIDTLLEGDIGDLQARIIEYGMVHYEEEIESHFNEVMDGFGYGEEAADFFIFLHAIWMILFVKLDDDKTIIERFIEEEKPSNMRPKLQQILESWRNPVILAGELEQLEGNNGTFVTTLEEERYTIQLIDYKPVSNDSYFLGMALPFGEKYVFYPMPLEYDGVGHETIEDFLYELYLASGYLSKQEFLIEQFFEIVKTIPGISQELDIENLNLAHPAYEDVLHLFKQKMEEEGESVENVSAGISTWVAYCTHRPKRIKNPSLYAASLHYLIKSDFDNSHRLTQKEIAGLYGVSHSSVSSVYGDMEHFLMEMSAMEDMGSDPFGMDDELPHDFSMEKMMGELQNLIKDQNIEDAEDLQGFLEGIMEHSPFGLIDSDEDEAQDLLYEAFESRGAKRYRLAEQSIDIYPLADAYTILAEKEKTLEKQLAMYQKALELGIEELGGEQALKENKGHFWGLIETRPYMRAKSLIAQTLVESGDVNAAIGHYEDLLDLNENDNQGVRYFLFPLYVALGKVNEAKQLLEEYDEGTSTHLYNELLLELMEKGNTAKADKLMKNAQKANPHIMKFLTGKKKVPKKQPDHYSPGAETEAITYAQIHKHLWDKVRWEG